MYNGIQIYTNKDGDKIDTRLWDGECEKWQSNQRLPKPGPHPDKYHDYNKKPEIYHIPEKE